MKSLFRGLSAFPITPANAEGIVDTDGVGRLTQRLLDAGVDSIGIVGSTGIYPYLAHEERTRTIAAAAEVVRGQVPLIAGVGSLRTDETIRLAQDAARAGADALLLTPLSYTPLTEDEVFELYKAVCEATYLPIVVYNTPTTTHFRISRHLMARLTALPNVAAFKTPLPLASTVREELNSLREGATSHLSIGYSDDWGAAAALMEGADTWYSVTAGLLPELCVALTKAALARKGGEVARLNERLQPLWMLDRAFNSLRVAYAAANELGLTEAQPPLPILPLTKEERQGVARALRVAIDGTLD
ncbi:dihydrodipicolinate synthase family protein [Formicincola oecophyllae]|uniref:Dihydrodipicolinate synthase family protein n=1 Tax=Formicincola oecophyllae TaxID=2558361 RepID=A0A4Y6UBC7_9PROT|nr:dihydrodipicolinate synthase family protein [Formicincola oecophyllae]QDH13767.1 dihydrodipicolinate synthase family protein [Formicincola oecophyllae]